MSEANSAGAPNTPAGGDEQNNAGTPPAGTAPPAGAPNEPNAKPAEGAKPAADVDYTFEFPEDMPVDAAEVDAFKAVAKDLELSKESAQKLANLRVQFAQTQMAKHAETVGKWRDDSKADKEFGGDKFDENLAVAKKARDAFATDGLKELLQGTRLGDHPEVIRFFFRVGQKLSEDSFVNPGATNGSGAGKDIADRLYSAN